MKIITTTVTIRCYSTYNAPILCGVATILGGHTAKNLANNSEYDIESQVYCLPGVTEKYHK